MENSQTAIIAVNSFSPKSAQALGIFAAVVARRERWHNADWRRERNRDPTFSSNRGRFPGEGGVKSPVL